MNSMSKLLLSTAFLWLNISNEYLPWYCPKPLCPMPPNGMLSRPYCKQTVVSVGAVEIASNGAGQTLQEWCITCTMASLNVTLPDDVSSMIRLFSFSFLVKA